MHDFLFALLQPQASDKDANIGMYIVTIKNIERGPSGDFAVLYRMEPMPASRYARRAGMACDAR